MAFLYEADAIIIDVLPSTLARGGGGGGGGGSSWKLVQHDFTTPPNELHNHNQSLVLNVCIKPHPLVMVFGCKPFGRCGYVAQQHFGTVSF